MRWKKKSVGKERGVVGVGAVVGVELRRRESRKGKKRK